jgi:hypothetical protein
LVACSPSAFDKGSLSISLAVVRRVEPVCRNSDGYGWAGRLWAEREAIYLAYDVDVDEW